MMEARSSAEYFVVRRGATALPNQTVHDRSLSISAVGLLAVMLSLPPGAPMGYRAFAGRGMGEKALRAILRELEEQGFRYRFLARRRTAEGKVRTVTITALSDTPIQPDEALNEVRILTSDEIVSCASHRDFEVQESCAAVGAAHEIPEAGSRVPRSGAAHRSAPHASTAQLLRSSKDSSLRSESLPSNRGDELVDNSVGVDSGGEGEPAAQRDDSLVRGVGSPPSAASPRQVTDVDRDVVADCLPSSMQPLPDTGTATVARRLHELRDGGWTADELRSILAAQALPREVRSMTRLVMYRLNDIDPSGSPAGRKRRRGEDRELLRECLPAWLWPPLGTGVEELGEYVRFEVQSGTAPEVIVARVARAFPREGGVPKAQAVLSALRRDSSAALSGGGR